MKFSKIRTWHVKYYSLKNINEDNLDPSKNHGVEIVSTTKALSIVKL